LTFHNSKINIEKKIKIKKMGDNNNLRNITALHKIHSGLSISVILKEITAIHRREIISGIPVCVLRTGRADRCETLKKYKSRRLA